MTAIPQRWLLYPLLAMALLTFVVANRVKYRFLAFVTGFWILAALWALIAWDLLVAGKG